MLNATLARIMFSVTIDIVRFQLNHIISPRFSCSKAFLKYNNNKKTLFSFLLIARAEGWKINASPGE